MFGIVSAKKLGQPTGGGPKEIRTNMKRDWSRRRSLPRFCLFGDSELHHSLAFGVQEGCDDAFDRVLHTPRTKHCGIHHLNLIALFDKLWIDLHTGFLHFLPANEDGQLKDEANKVGEAVSDDGLPWDGRIRIDKDIVNGNGPTLSAGRTESEDLLVNLERIAIDLFKGCLKEGAELEGADEGALVFISRPTNAGTLGGVTSVSHSKELTSVVVTSEMYVKFPVAARH